MTKICVPVCVDSFAEMRAAVERASQAADIIELRLDCVDKQRLAEVLENYGQLRALARKPFIVTLRPAEQGGHALTLKERTDFWIQQSRLWFGNELQTPDLVDIEAELLIDRSAETDYWRTRSSGPDVICSHHDFTGVPDNLEACYEQMFAASASIIKLAVQADDASDCIPVFRLIKRAQSEGRKIIAIAMGNAGLMTRILGPSRGSFLTYGSLDEESGTAAGQVTARDLRNIYRIDSITPETAVFGIIGNPVMHSLSPHIHNAAFAESGLDAVYIPFEVRDAAEFMRRMVQPRSREMDWNLRGLSVTAPHKMTVMHRLDWIEPAAKEMRAVNTIVVRDDQLYGYNTDAVGLISPLRRKYGSLEQASCAVIGAGGAARAALWALKREGANVAMFSRDPSRADFVAHQFDAESKSLTGASFNGFDVVVNTTPLGTLGENQGVTAATAQQLRGVRLAYDLVYNPVETRFLSEARAAGCDTLGGIEMLLAQAVEQFKLWTGREPNVETMQAAASQALSK